MISLSLVSFDVRRVLAVWGACRRFGFTNQEITFALRGENCNCGCNTRTHFIVCYLRQQQAVVVRIDSPQAGTRILTALPRAQALWEMAMPSERDKVLTDTRFANVLPELQRQLEVSGLLQTAINLN